MTSYLLDANVFIEAKDKYYDFDVCPGFWDWLDAQREAARVLSIERVGTELNMRDDRLAGWAEARGTTLFLPPDEDVITSLQAVANWATQSGYTPAAISQFLQKADSSLVAHAHAHQHIVVTHEVIEGKKHKIKIPAACVAMKVQCMNPFEMLRLEHATFVLGART